MTASNGDPGAVVIPPVYGISTNALREGEAKTPSPDAEGRVRLRNPAGAPVYEEQSPTLDSGAPHMVGPVNEPYTVHAAESMAKERHAFPTETARSLDTTGGFASQQGGTIVLADTLRSHPRPGSNSSGALVESVALRGRDGGATAELGGDIMHALRSSKGGGDKPHVLRMREGKDGGGKGPLLSEDASLTLSRANDQTLFAPASVRRLTPTECERLQAFPDGWTCLCGCEPYSTEACTCPDGPRYAAMGNAVTVSQAYRVLALVDPEVRAGMDRSA